MSRQSEMPDDWIQRARDGDMAALDMLVRCYQDRIYQLCYWFMKDAAEADDMAQETFMRAFKAMARFRGDAALSTWLYRIGVNTCKNRLNALTYRIRKYFTHSLDAGDAPDLSATGNPASELIDKERHILLHRAIAQLPTDKKQMIILRDIQGLAYDEIARIADIKIGTVKSRLARARQALYLILRDDW